jgi:hypothetical protein
MNALTKMPPNMGQMSSRFAGVPMEDDLSGGISGGFGRISFKGKTWKVHHRSLPDGEKIIERNDGSGDSVGSIEVVILKASTALSKTYYKGGFVEGSAEPPTCMSGNGVVPDAQSIDKQAATCALCPKNRWGSDERQDGTAGKGKACKDTKRLAVVPLDDIENDTFGGPMLLRVPPASLQDVATYGKAVNKLGYHYYGVATRIGFDVKEAYPKLKFSPMRALTDAEADIVIAHQKGAAIDSIMAEAVVGQAALPAPEEPEVQFEQPPVKAAPVEAPAPEPVPDPVVVPAPAPVKARATKPKPAAPVEAAPPPTVPDQPTSDVSFDDALDAELNALMGD